MFYRTYVLVHSGRDGIVALADIGLLSSLEVWLGIIVACLPTTAPVFKAYLGPAMFKVSERLFGPSQNSKQYVSPSQHVNTIGGSGQAGRGKTGRARWPRASDSELSLGSIGYGERPSHDIPFVSHVRPTAVIRADYGSNNSHLPAAPGVYVSNEFQTHTNAV